MKRSLTPFPTALVALSLVAGPLQAEPVRIQQDGGRFAQGWLFTDYRGICRIVTAAHVLEHGGRLGSPVAVDRKGREIVTGNPAQPDKHMDIAFLEARPSVCSTDSLAEGDADRRLTLSANASLEFVGLTENRTLPLVRRARTRDEFGGRVVLFQPSTPSAPMSQGISGGAIVDSSGMLLAIVFEVDPARNHVLGVRSDVISVLNRELSDVQHNTPIAGWTTWYGKTVDPQRGVDSILDSDRGWTVEPDRGYVIFGLQLKSAQTVGSVRFRVDDASRGQVVQVEISGSESTAQSTNDWPMIGSCKPPPGSATIVCDFLPRTIRFLRVQVRMTSREATLSNLTITAR